jgi:hypothetical protein
LKDDGYDKCRDYKDKQTASEINSEDTDGTRCNLLVGKRAQFHSGEARRVTSRPAALEIPSGPTEFVRADFRGGEYEPRVNVLCSELVARLNTSASSAIGRTIHATRAVLTTV